MKYRQSKGNINLIAVLMIVFAVLAGLYLTWKSGGKAPTAIEAAALQAASDMGRIVVEGNFGRVALVDDRPDEKDPDRRPVMGINTILATRRNALLVARTLGNTSLLYPAGQDLKRAEEDALRLRKAIFDAIEGTGPARDKRGRPINLKKDVEEAYKKSQGGNFLSGSISIQVGQLDLPVNTNIPVPVPHSFDTDLNSNKKAAAMNGSQKVYRAYVPVDTRVFGKNFPITFAGVGNSPELIKNARLQPLESTMPPAAVRVSLKKQSADSGETELHAMARAGGPRLDLPDGTLCVSFPQGFPPNRPVDFTSVKSIMNSSMLPVEASASTPSPYRGWMVGTKGNWFRVRGGPVPEDPGAGLQRSPFRSRRSDDPAVALSFMVYDWIVSLGLKPNIAAVDRALSADIHSYLNQHDPGASTTFTAAGAGFIPPALARASGSLKVTSAIFGINESGAGDPRDLSLWDENPSAYRQQLINSWGYLPASATIPPTCRVVAMTADGEAVTTNGQPISVLHSLWEQMKKMQDYARPTWMAASQVAAARRKEIDELEARLDRLEQSPGKDAHPAFPLSAANRAAGETKKIDGDLKKAYAGLRRARNAMSNARYCASVFIAMIQNQKVLTAGGVEKIAEDHYKLAEGDFYPPGRAATIEEIESSVPVGTGQSESAPVRDWCAPAENGRSPLHFYRHKASPVIGRVEPKSLLLPVFAQDCVPPSQNLIFSFNVLGDASSPDSTPDTGKIRLSALPRSPFSAMSTLSGQVQYQNLNALRTPAGEFDLVWLVQARDNNACTDGAYFADKSASGYDIDPPDWCHRHYYGSDKMGSSACAPLVVEWQIKSPVPLTPAAYCTETTVMRADGTVVGVAYPCPPPPATQ